MANVRRVGSRSQLRNYTLRSEAFKFDCRRTARFVEAGRFWKCQDIEERRSPESISSNTLLQSTRVGFWRKRIYDGNRFVVFITTSIIKVFRHMGSRMRPRRTSFGQAVIIRYRQCGSRPSNCRGFGFSNQWANQSNAHQAAKIVTQECTRIWTRKPLCY